MLSGEKSARRTVLHPWKWIIFHPLLGHAADLSMPCFYSFHYLFRPGFEKEINTCFLHMLDHFIDTFVAFRSSIAVSAHCLEGFLALVSWSPYQSSYCLEINILVKNWARLRALWRGTVTIWAWICAVARPDWNGLNVLQPRLLWGAWNLWIPAWLRGEA